MGLESRQASNLDKRFSLKRDSEQPSEEKVFASEKLHALREAYIKLKEKHPEAVAVTAFGSLTKGEGTPTSDVDAVLYIDFDNASLPNIKTENVFSDIAYESLFPTQTSQTINEAREKYSKEFEEDIIASLNEVQKTEAMKSIEPMVLPMSFEMIDKIVMAETKWTTRIGLGDVYSDFYTPAQPSKNRPEYRANVAYFMLSTMFLMDVGGGIRPYREYLLKKLSEKRNGPRVWEKIVKVLEEFEGGGAQRNVMYPKTLSEAINLYAPNLKEVNS